MRILIFDKSCRVRLSGPIFIRSARKEYAKFEPIKIEFVFISLSVIKMLTATLILLLLLALEGVRTTLNITGPLNAKYHIASYYGSRVLGILPAH